MKGFITQVCLIGIVLSVPPVFAQPPAVFPEQKQLAELKAKYELEFKAQLAQKPLEERSPNEIYEIALQVAQTVYRDHPALMRRKFLYDLSQIPQFDENKLKTYRVEKSLELLELFQTSHLSKLGSTQADVLAIFYGKRPEAIAQTFKNMMLTKVWTAKQFGYWSMISHFLPDKTYRLDKGDESALVIHTYDNNLFMFNFDVTESGLIKPLTIQWMKPKTGQS